MTVFNLRSEKGNTFTDLTATEVKNRMEMFEPCNYAHAVYAYPNFTLIRKRNIPIFEKGVEISLTGIFIAAAYPAAGLLVAAQQAKNLDSRKIKFGKDSPSST